MNLRRFPATREISIGVLFYLYLPVLVLIVYSFNDNRTATIWTEASLRWYANAINSDEFMDPKWMATEAINMPEEFADRLVPTQDCSPAARELQDKIWTRLKG